MSSDPIHTQHLTLLTHRVTAVKQLVSISSDVDSPSLLLSRTSLLGRRTLLLRVAVFLLNVFDILLPTSSCHFDLDFGSTTHQVNFLHDFMKFLSIALQDDVSHRSPALLFYEAHA